MFLSRSFIFCLSALHSSGWWVEVGVDGVVELGPECPQHWVRYNVPKMAAGRPKGAARLKLKAYFSNLSL